MHARSPEHCAGLLQPHIPPRQIGPGLQLVTQSEHAPELPQATFAVPSWHVGVVPEPPQQPPLQGVRFVAPHRSVQT
jgi:hypothetical protein